MEEEKIIELLKGAYSKIQRGDGRGYWYCIRKVEAEIKKIDEGGGNSDALRGELLLTSIFESLQNFDEFCSKVKAASQLIPGRSRVFPEGANLFGEYYDVFSLCNLESGHADENMKKLNEIEELFYRLTGGGKGTSLCYQAQLAYFRGDLENARIFGKQALKQGEKYRQGVVCVCAVEFLSRVAKHIQDKDLYYFTSDYITKLAEGTREVEGYNCCGYAEVIRCLLDSSIGLLQTVPEWLRQGDMGIIPAPWGFEAVAEKVPVGIFGVALMTRVQYLVYTGQPMKALNEMEMIEKIYKIKSVAVDAYLAAFRAGCYKQIGDMERVNQHLLRLIEIISPDKLWLIAAEFLPEFGEKLYDAVAQVNPYGRDVIQEIGDGSLKKLEPMWEAAIDSAPAELSLREKEVAALLIEGRTNAQIAEELNISVRTVRTHLENIYRKKSITRRGQVSSAMKHRAVEMAYWAGGTKAKRKYTY